MRSRTFVLLSVMTVGMYLHLSLAEGTERIAFVKNGEIWTTEGGVSRQVTSDGIAKWLPVWSKDGSRIAFLRGTPRSQALCDLVVISSDGTSILSEIPIRPVADETVSGMGNVEKLEWVTHGRIAVSGNLNPSTIETVVVDLTDSREVEDFYDDGGGVVFAPTGVHAAYLDGSPHFTPRELRDPALNIDNVRVFPNKGSIVQFLSQPAWSQFGDRLAIVAEDVKSKARTLVVWNEVGGLSTIGIPASVNDEVSLSWTDDGFVMSSGGRTFLLKTSASTLSEIASAALEAQEKAERDFRQSMRSFVQKIGGDEADVWCDSCVVSHFPRRNSLYQQP